MLNFGLTKQVKYNVAFNLKNTLIRYQQKARQGKYKVFRPQKDLLSRAQFRVILSVFFGEKDF
jgi:hypothetical protein